MQFLNPLFLIGLAAASIPVILHLLNLRKLKTVEFSTVRFLKELQKTRIRRLRIRQIILLILRTLIIIFAVMAFARPTIEGNLPLAETYTKSSAVILVDNSFSMDVSDEFGSRINQAKSAARQALGSLRDGDEAAVITMSDPDKQLNISLSRNFNFLKQKISEIKVSNTPANLDNSLRVAMATLEDAMNINREIYIISDFQNNVLGRTVRDSAKLDASGAAVYMIPIGYESRAEIKNVSVDSVALLTRIFQIDKLIETETYLRNNSDTDIEGLVASMLYNDQRIAQRSVDLPAGRIKSISLASAPESQGAVRGSIEIESDALDADNRRYFGFIIPEKPAVAIAADRSARRFIDPALAAPIKRQSFADVQFFEPSQLSGINLSNYELLIISSVNLTKNDYERLRKYISGGGSVFLAAGPDMDLEQMNKQLQLFGLGGVEKVDFAESSPGRYSSVDRMHPMFEGVFKGETDSKNVVESPTIFRAYPASGGQPIIEMPGGSFLAESRIDKGKIIYCAAPLSDEWSTLPLTGIYPTLLYRSIIYLTAREDYGVYTEAGRGVRLSLPKRFAGGGNFRIVDPAGNEFFAQAAILPSGAVLSLNELDRFGVYVVYSPDGRLASIISVNPAASESILSSPSESDMRSWMNTFFKSLAGVEFITGTENIRSSVKRARTGTELWQLFVLLAIICAVAELLVERNTKRELGEKV
jgi:hypothetical protein